MIELYPIVWLATNRVKFRVIMNLSFFDFKPSIFNFLIELFSPNMVFIFNTIALSIRLNYPYEQD